MKKVIYFILLLSIFAFAAGPIISGPISGGGGGGVTAETDPIVGAVNGIVVADGAGNITGITSSTDMQAFLGTANDAAARTELGLGSLATQNADNAIVTNLTANVIKTDTSADATLSGTPIIITVYDAASNTPYYFKAYPTKK